MKSEKDEQWMLRAVELSRRGYTAPNPHVGCVIVQNDQVVGEGWHAFAGGHHAEVAALKKAGTKAKGATAYVTLEPCNHYGKTPPCTKALIEAGVKRVVIACEDPNPRAAGGIKVLQEAGIDVETGVCVEKARSANLPFLEAMRLKRAFVVVKAAMSLDGRIALPSGESQWITSEKARREGHRLRAQCGAVLVGRRTVELDDPSLTARIPGVKNQPVKVVIDPMGRLMGNERVFQGPARTIHVTRDAFPQLGSDHQIDVEALLSSLFEQGLTSLLVEGGAKTIAGFIQAGCVDRYELFMAPKLLGDGPSWIQGLSLGRLADAPELAIERIRRIGNDIQVTARPKRV